MQCRLWMPKAFAGFAVVTVSLCSSAHGQAGDGSVESLIARGAQFELGSVWETPPGDGIEHATAGFAKVLCSAIFITGLDVAEAADKIGYFVSMAEERQLVTDTIVDYDNRAVHLTLNTGVTRTAKFYGDQGCVALPPGRDSVYFTPVEVTSALPDPLTQPWPMGDVLSDEPLPSEVDQEKVAAAVEAAFDPAGMTGAFVVVYKRRIIGERYREGMDKDTQFESWSQGKSLTGTLMGTLIQKGVYDLWESAPVDAWHATPGDPRAAIRIGDIMQMSSGLHFVAPQDPDYNLEFGYPQGYPDHFYVYTGAIDSHQWSITRPAQWNPNTVGRYRNSDPLATNYLIRKAVEEELGEDYHTYPQRALFDKIGIRKMYLETDPYGNLLLQGYEFGTGRNWARLGMLYLQDGVWNGERILPGGYVEYASTVAPSWQADGRPIYGGAFFWINGTGNFPIPRDAFYMAGAGGQFTIIIPSHDMVVARLGLYKGSGPGMDALRSALALLMEAVPAKGGEANE